MTDFYYGDGQQLSRSTGSASLYYISDQLDNTRVVVNSTGGTVFSSDYQPCGISVSPSGTEALLYNGQVYDSVTGLFYYKARFYDPIIQRFMTEDIVSGRTNAQSLYAYTQDNPETFNDPNGHGTTGIYTFVNSTRGSYHLQGWIVEWGGSTSTSLTWLTLIAGAAIATWTLAGIGLLVFAIALAESTSFGASDGYFRLYVEIIYYKVWIVQLACL